MGGSGPLGTTMWMDSRPPPLEAGRKRYMIYLWSAATLIPSLLPSCRPARLRRRRVAPVSHETAADSMLLTVNYCRNETRLQSEFLILTGLRKGKVFSCEQGRNKSLGKQPDIWDLKKPVLSNQHPLKCWSSRQDSAETKTGSSFTATTATTAFAIAAVTAATTTTTTTNTTATAIAATTTTSTTGTSAAPATTTTTTTNTTTSILLQSVAV